MIDTAKKRCLTVFCGPLLNFKWVKLQCKVPWFIFCRECLAGNMAERRSVIQIFTVHCVYLRVTVRVKFMPRKIRALGAPCNTSFKIVFFMIQV